MGETASVSKVALCSLEPKFAEFGFVLAICVRDRVRWASHEVAWRRIGLLDVALGSLSLVLALLGEVRGHLLAPRLISHWLERGRGGHKYEG